MRATTTPPLKGGMDGREGKKVEFGGVRANPFSGFFFALMRTHATRLLASHFSSSNWFVSFPTFYHREKIMFQGHWCIRFYSRLARFITMSGMEATPRLCIHSRSMLYKSTFYICFLLYSADIFLDLFEKGEERLNGWRGASSSSSSAWQQARPFKNETHLFHLNEV